jgi:pimeloyl-ACP methyl ester carboxylesterase
MREGPCDRYVPLEKEQVMPDREITSSRSRKQLLSALPVAERRLELAGISTAVLEGGEGAPLVLLHGPGANALHWMRVIPALARNHRVIAPDLPGHGATAAFTGELDVSLVLSWLDALIELTSAARPAIAGQLLGGAIAARFAAERPSRLSRLILIDTFGLSEFRPLAEFGAAISGFFSAPDASAHESLWQFCAYDLDGLKRQLGERWQDFQEYNVECAGSAALRASMPALMQLFACPLDPVRLRGIAVPTTLVWGRHDLATPLAVAEGASQRYGWPLRVIENANDDPPFEQPDALVSVLRDELSRPS